ncbi:hypothetical protein Tco_1151984 [Tanacetum coccineum]
MDSSAVYSKTSPGAFTEMGKLLLLQNAKYKELDVVCLFEAMIYTLLEVSALLLGLMRRMELNAIFSKPIKELLSLETEVDDAALISIDSKGTYVLVRQGAQSNIQRLAFKEGHGVETLEEAKAALWNLIHRGGGLKLKHKF